MLREKARHRPEGSSCLEMGGACYHLTPFFQAHEDSEKLREIVLPMEQEIEELKAKLLRAEELIQEIQVRGRPGGTAGRGGTAGPWPPSLLPDPSPRDVPGTPLPCTAPRSC